MRFIKFFIFIQLSFFALPAHFFQLAPNNNPFKNSTTYKKSALQPRFSVNVNSYYSYQSQHPTQQQIKQIYNAAIAKQQKKIDEQKHKQQQAIEAQRKQKRNRQKKQEEKVLTQLKNVLPIQQKELLYLINEWEKTDNNTLSKRATTARATLNNPHSYTPTYHLSDKARTIFSEYDDLSYFQEFTGSPIQQALHQELIDIYNQAAEFTYPQTIKYQKNIGQIGAIAHEANKNGGIVITSRLLDYCWGLLNCAKAVALGIKDGVVNTIDTCLHPIKAVQDLAEGIVQTARALACLAKEVGLLSYYAVADQDTLHERIFDYKEKITALRSALGQVKMEVILRQATALGVEVVLLNKIISHFRHISKTALMGTKSWLDATRQASEFSLAVEGAHISATATASEYLEYMAVNSESILPKMRGKVTKTLSGTSQKFIPLEEEIALLRMKFKNAKVNIPYRHIFQPDIREFMRKDGTIGKTMGGWHHDLKQIFFKNKHFKGNLIEFLGMEKDKQGIYKLKWKIFQKTKKSTFFPSNWTRKQVIEKIFEAEKYIKKNKVIFKKQLYGKNYEAIGFTTEGIKIKFIKNYQGNFISIFPEITRST